MKKSLWWIGLIVIAGSGAALWFYVKKNKANVTKADILALIVPPGQKPGEHTVFDDMTQQELNDSYRVINAKKSGNTAELDAIQKDEAFMNRLQSIADKYGDIF